MELKKKANELPKTPGVYLMKDSLGNIIYVGKSKTLKNRVSQYFQNSKHHSPKVVKMVSNIHDFDYVLTDTEFEALLLECRLIKEIKPTYNRLMKNHMGYPYIKLTINEEFPRILIDTEDDDKGCLYFGPYTSSNLVERAVEVLKKNFNIRKCDNVYFNRKSSGCLNFHLGACSGICRGSLKSEEYMESLNDIIDLLRGKNKDLQSSLEVRMKKAAEEMDFDSAAKFRDDISALRYILSSESMIKSINKKKNIVIGQLINENEMKIFFIRGNSLLHKENIYSKDMSKNELKAYLTKAIFEYFKVSTSMKSNDVRIGQEDIDEINIIHSFIKSKKLTNLWVPQSWIDKNQYEKIEQGIDKLFSLI